MSDNEYAPSPWEPIAHHVERYLATDGDDGFEWHGAKCVIVTTTGARSGKLRRTPLIRVADGDRYLLVASMGGAPSHPNWYVNIVANPEITIQDRADVHELRARTATPDEKAELWPLVIAQWPDYDDYQAKTERDIPVVVCEPR
ncbi:MAG: nitroreductase family deazaflavin-dependent oxidoreductase [Acidimicrobiia bacterium]|nr:nitroreductase family deazaflavin-dependent oxidoreductase [Acidimicrobiia bacterium]